MTTSQLETLHIISKSPSHQQLYTDMLSATLENDAILLTQNAVYTLTCRQLDVLIESGNPVYALKVDVEAHGLANLTNSLVTHISDEQFVELCCLYKKTLSWF